MKMLEKQRAMVFVVDDDPAVLKAVGWLLQAGGYAVELFDSPRKLFAASPARRAACVVIDLHLPEISGLAVQAALREGGCAPPLVFITGQGDVPSSVQAMKGGAVDFLLKPVGDKELLGAVARAVARDAEARAESTRLESLSARHASLSPREREVCARVARGLLNKQIAAELGISEHTVKVHRAKAMDRLGVGSAAELASFWQRFRGEQGSAGDQGE